jgi:hypothetical protein
MAAALAVAAPAAHGARRLDLEVLNASLRPVETLEVAIPPGATSTMVRFYLRQRGRPREEIEGVALVTDRVRGLTLAAEGANAKGRFEVPASPGLVSVTATFDGATAPVAQRGWLMARQATTGVVRRLVPVTTSRSVKDALAIEGAGNEGFALTRSVSTFEQNFDIVLTGTDEVDDLRLAVDPFHDDRRGRVVPEVRVGGAPLEPAKRYAIRKDAPLELKVTASLPAKGKHMSRIVMRYGGQRVVVPLTVTRKKAAASIDVAEVPSSRVELGAREKRGRAEFKLRVRETDGRDTQLDAPEMVLLRKDGSSSLKTTDHGFTIDTAAPAPVLIPAGETRTLTAGLADLEPGEYTAQVALPGGEGAPKQVNATILVRRSIWIAALLLLIGVLLSILARDLWVRRRDEIRARQTVALVAGELDRILLVSPPTVAEGKVVDAIRDKLVTIDETFVNNPADDVKNPAADVKAELTEIRARLPVLSRYLKLAGAAREAGVYDEVRADLETAEDYLQYESASADEADTALDKVGTYLRQAPKLKAAIDELASALEAWRGEHPGGPVPKGDEIGKKVVDARAALLREDLATAATLHDEGWGLLATATADELRDLVSSADPPPGLDAAAWQDLANFVRAAVGDIGALPPMQAVSRYRATYREYLHRITAGMRGRVSDKLKAAQTAGNQDVVAAMEELRGLLVGVEDHLAGDRLAPASQAYEQARQKWMEKKAAGMLMSASGAPENDAAPAGSSAVPQPVDAGRVPEGLTEATSSLPKSADLARQLRDIETLVTLVAAVAAVGSGLVLLYYAEPVWGTVKDMVVAVLWGLGLHQAGVAAFPGVTATADTMAGVRAPA